MKKSNKYILVGCCILLCLLSLLLGIKRYQEVNADVSLNRVRTVTIKKAETINGYHVRFRVESYKLKKTAKIVNLAVKVNIKQLGESYYGNKKSVGEYTNNMWLDLPWDFSNPVEKVIDRNGRNVTALPKLLKAAQPVTLYFEAPKEVFEKTKAPAFVFLVPHKNADIYTKYVLPVAK